MEKKWFIGIDISKKTLDVVIYVPTKKHADETNYERFLNKEEASYSGDAAADHPGSEKTGRSRQY